MPRILHPALRRMLERANPNVQHIVEINRPDVGQVLRRAPDQFFGAPLVSQTPASSLNADGAGALTLNSAATTVASFTGESSNVGLPLSKPDQYLRGLEWSMPASFDSCVLRKFSARLHATDATISSHARSLQLGLQIYRAVWTAFPPAPDQGRFAIPKSSWTRAWSFVPLLSQQRIVRSLDFVWTADVAWVEFDLTTQRIELARRPAPDKGAYQDGEDPAFYFVIDPVDGSKDNQFEWKRDAATSRTVAGVGSFLDVEWDRSGADIANAAVWTRKPYDGTAGTTAQVPTCEIDVEEFVPTSTAIYAITLPAVPTAASLGRVDFERAEPTGTSAALAVSTAGSGGPWTTVTDGDALATKQATYHLRAILTANATQRRAPSIAALGVEFRTPVDVSAEAIVTPIGQAIDMPFCAAAVGQGTIGIMRTGRVDFHDPGTELVVSSPVSKLEAEVYLGSRHPSAPRSTWCKIDDAIVSDRQPTATAEQLTMLSSLKLLKKKIPERAETINSVHTVTAATAAQVTVTPALPGTTAGGNEYDGAGYYLRVRSSTQVGVATGSPPVTIAGNTGTTKLDFSPVLAGTFAVNDVIEVHSGLFVQPGLTWLDQDPADIWWEILTVRLGISDERIGHGNFGSAGRSGLPPRVTDRAPGDATTQAKLRVTFGFQGAEDADKLIDQLSFLMGGTTVEIGGQIVFRQIYPLRDANGQVSVDVEPVAVVFDERDVIGLQTPVGLERRISSLACDFGVDTTAVSKDTPPANTNVFNDVDAIAWLATQDIDDLAFTAVPDDIARWCFNSADGGQFLSGQLCVQVVLIASTGLRGWSWGSTAQYPQLVIGDRVAVVTEQYTDYDPSRQMAIRGRWAYPLVITGVAGGGRQFQGVVTGLSSAVRIRGGPGTITTPTFGDDANTPSLTVTPTPGVGSYSIAYVAGAGTTVTLSINGAAPITPGASPLIVTRTFLDQTYTFFGAKGSTTIPIAVTVPALQATMGNGSMDVATDGYWGAVIDLPDGVTSVRWLSSTSSMPVDATVAVSGTPVTISGVFTLSAQGPLTIGQSNYLTVAMYKSGSLYRFVHLRASYTSFTATKTVAYSATAAMGDPSSSVPTFSIGSDGAVWCDALSAGTFTNLWQFLVVPDGVTITQISADYYDANSTASSSSWRVFRNETHGLTLLGFQLPTQGIGWQSLSIGVTESTTGRSYVAATQMIGASGGSAAGDERTGQTYVTFTMPQPKASI